MKFCRLAIVAGGILAMTGCGGSSSSSMPSGSSSAVQVRFAQGAPELEALINGVPQDIGAAYLQVDGQTVTNTFTYGSLTQFLPFPPGDESLVALDDVGYRVGPFKSPALAGGKRYTLILVGSYPNYRVLAFEEPASLNGNAQLSLYEASPSVPKADFGSFIASSRSGLKHLGSATLGSVATVSLGASVSNVGGYVGHGTKPFTCGQVVPCGEVTPASVNSFDKKNALPFHNATRLSLFLFDAKCRSSSGYDCGPVFGSLDR
jgi:hypothetical protein